MARTTPPLAGLPEPAEADFTSDEVPAGPEGVVQRPPRLLLTLLGDYWWRRVEPLPSAALVALLAEFGVSDSHPIATNFEMSSRATSTIISP